MKMRCAVKLKRKRALRRLRKNIRLLPALVNWRLKLPQRIL